MMMLPLSEEKRTSLRVPVSLATRIVLGNHEYEGKILNLSTEGIFVKSSHLLDAGDLVQLSFSVPGNADPVQVKARVMWGGSMEGPVSRTYAMGIHFESLTTGEQDSLSTYIQNLLNA